jgi:hypothetical protein
VDDVPLAKHVYTAMKAKNGDGGTALSQFSVGLNVIKEGYEKRENDMVVVLLEKCDLVEWGSCLKGINPATYNIATKADDIRRLVTKGLLTPDDLRTALEVDIQGGTDLKKALPVSDLGFTARGAVFDSDGARQRVKEYASDADGNVDFNTYSKAFLWVDDGKGAASNLTSYRFVVADVVGDELRYVPKASSPQPVCSTAHVAVPTSATLVRRRSRRVSRSCTPRWQLTLTTTRSPSTGRPRRVQRSGGNLPT